MIATYKKTGSEISWSASTPVLPNGQGGMVPVPPEKQNWLDQLFEKVWNKGGAEVSEVISEEVSIDTCDGRTTYTGIVNYRSGNVHKQIRFNSETNLELPRPL